MKKFRIVYSARGSVVVEADGEDDAEEMFMDGQVDFGFDGATIDYIEEITEGETSPSGKIEQMDRSEKVVQALSKGEAI